MGILISALITFGSLWLLIAAFDSGVDNKMKRILLLTAILVAVSFIASFLGLIGGLIGGIINLIAIMRILGYEIVTAFLFSLGLSLLNILVVSKVLS